MSWNGEGRRPYSDKKQEKDRYRKLTLAILKETSLQFLDDLSIPQEFKDKAREAKKISVKHVARRRVERRMVELMRHMDEEVIVGIESLIGKSDQIAAENEQRVIRLRTKLLEGDNAFFTDFVSQYPQIEIQKLRQCIRNARKDVRNYQQKKEKEMSENLMLDSEHQKNEQREFLQVEIFQIPSIKVLNVLLREIIL
jgi:ribosome-associated protein